MVRQLTEMGITTVHGLSLNMNILVHILCTLGDAASAPDQAMEDESEGSGNDQSAPLSAEFHFVPSDSASREHYLMCICTATH